MQSDRRAFIDSLQPVEALQPSYLTSLGQSIFHEDLWFKSIGIYYVSENNIHPWFETNPFGKIYWLWTIPNEGLLLGKQFNISSILIWPNPERQRPVNEALSSQASWAHHDLCRLYIQLFSWEPYVTLNHLYVNITSIQNPSGKST